MGWIRRSFVTLDMRGRLRINVADAIRNGVWADEIKAARKLAAMLRRGK